MSDIVSFVEQLKKQFPQKLPPVHLWNPPLSGDMDMRIAVDGKWFHEGDEIRRDALVTLFSSILKKENDEYFLVTPVEKWKIQVDCAPFVVVSFEQLVNQNASDFPVLSFLTLTDDKVFVDADHPVWVETHKNLKTGREEPLPFVMVRDGLKALIHRNVYYQLVELALESQNELKNCDDGSEEGRSEEGSEKKVQQTDLFISSGKERFSLKPKVRDQAAD
ncbi:MAG: DUF1285 domain-containing protein [Cellvibrionaceae bacterium]